MFPLPAFGLVFARPVPHFLSVLNMGAALSITGASAEQEQHTFCCAFFPLDSVFLLSEESAFQKQMEVPYPVSIAWDSAELWFETDYPSR